MSERNHYEPGVPCWVESIQPDPEAAAAFYGRVFGWEADAREVRRGVQYVLARLRGRDVAGFAPMPPTVSDAAPGWTTHVRVADVDAAAERVRAAGGRLVFGPLDAAPAGRMGVMADP